MFKKFRKWYRKYKSRKRTIRAMMDSAENQLKKYKYDF